MPGNYKQMRRKARDKRAGLMSSRWEKSLPAIVYVFDRI